MLKKTITAILLIAISHISLGGCSRAVRAELHQTGHLRHDRITGVVLKSGDPISFSPAGGLYNRITGIITGITPEDQRRSFELAELDSIMVVAVVQNDTLGVTLPADDLADFVRGMKRRTILAAVNRENDTLRFDRSGGVIDPSALAVTGRGVNDEGITCPLRDVDHFVVRKAKTTANILLFAGAAVSVTVILIALTADLEIDWQNSAGQ